MSSSVSRPKRPPGVSRSAQTLELMLFAFATDDRSLEVFASEAEAVASCEGADVASSGYLFFAGDGSPLEPVFSEPAVIGSFVVTHGRYSLRACSGAHLRDVLPRVSVVEGPTGIQSVADVARVLTSHSSGPPTASAELQR